MRKKENHVAHSRARSEWELVDRDIRVFMDFGLRVASEAYDAIWEAVASEPSDGELDLPDVFHDRVDGLWQHDYEWMLLGGTLRDAVTAFEVYLEKAIEEVLVHNGYTLKRHKGHMGLKWWELKDTYKNALGLELETPEVKEIRALRHILVHNRGELRTEEQRKQYGNPESVFGWSAHLTKELVTEHMDALSDCIASIDPTVWESSWGREKPEPLRAFLSASERTRG